MCACAWKKFECEAWLSLASALSVLRLYNNHLTTLPEGVFSNLSSLRSLVCLRGCESDWVWEWLSVRVSLPLSGICTHLFSRARTHSAHSHAHNLELPCRQVWGLTLCRSLSQVAWSSLQQADGAFTRSILGAFFAEVACVFEREKLHVCFQRRFLCVLNSSTYLPLHVHAHTHAHAHTDLLTYIHGAHSHTRVWGLTLSRSSSQLAWSSL